MEIQENQTKGSNPVSNLSAKCWTCKANSDFAGKHFKSIYFIQDHRSLTKLLTIELQLNYPSQLPQYICGVFGEEQGRGGKMVFFSLPFAFLVQKSKGIYLAIKGTHFHFPNISKGLEGDTNLQSALKGSVMSQDILSLKGWTPLPKRALIPRFGKRPRTECAASQACQALRSNISKCSIHSFCL